MAAWLHNSKHLLGVSRLLQSTSLIASESSSLPIHRHTAHAAFATVSNKSKKTETSPTDVASTESTSTDLIKGKKSKAKKEPILNSYARFVKDQYQTLKSSTSGKLEVRTASKVLGAKWKALSDEERKPYKDAAAKDKALSDEAKKPHIDTAAKDKKADAKPKRKPSGYHLWLKENLESVKNRNPTVAPKQVMVNMAHEWREMAPERKHKYMEMARES